MNIPNKIRFEVANGLSNEEVLEAEFVIYAHECSSGLYVGMARDPVLRWQQHVQDAMNEHSQHNDDLFREAIKRNKLNFKHYILAGAKFEKAAKRKEAEAIRYYPSSLNMRPENCGSDTYACYKPLDKQITTSIILEKRSRSGTSISREDTDRVSIVAEVYMNSGRKRLRCTKGQSFKEGLRVECSRSEREKFNPGDKVIVKVALSTQKGKDYLVAAKTSPLRLAK